MHECDLEAWLDRTNLFAPIRQYIPTNIHVIINNETLRDWHKCHMNILSDGFLVL